MSTRRAEPFAFDHGAQYFRAETPAFNEFVAQMVVAGHIAPWQPRLMQVGPGSTGMSECETGVMYAASPAMNSLCKSLAEGLTVLRSKRAASLSRRDGAWTIACEDGEDLAGFDWVLSTAPAEQTRALVPDDAGFGAVLQSARMQGCFTLMLGFDTAPDVAWDAIRLQGPMLGWIANNATKPGRQGLPGYVVQTTNDWADANLKRPLAEVEAEILSAFQAVTGIAQAPAYQSLHRWRYAAVAHPADAPFLMDDAAGLAAAGDWCGTGKVEAAYVSGLAAAEAIAARL